MNRSVWVFCVFLMGFLLYGNTLHSPFQFDDLPFIQFNPAITDITNLNAIRAFNPPRFVGNLSFALNYFFNEIDVFGYHFVNIVVHIVTALLIGSFIALVFRRFKRHEDDDHLFGKIGTVLFLFHPLHTTAVNHITQRYTSLVALFFMMSVFFYGKAREISERKEKSDNKRVGLLLLGFFVAAILAMQTKQTSFILPVMICVFEFYCYAESKFIRSRKIIILALMLLLLIVPATMNFSFRSVFIPEQISQSHDLQWVTPTNYLWTQLCVIPRYIYLLFYPISLNFDYDISLSHSFFEPIVVLSTTFILMLILTAFFLRRSQPLISFGIAWYFLNLIVESSIIPLPYVMTEYRAYLPSVGWIMVVLGLFSLVIKNKKILMVLLSIVLAIFGFLTFQRNNVWRSEISLWEDTVHKSLNKSRPHINLGAAYYLNKEYDKALEQYYDALSMSPHNALIFYNIGCVYKDMKNMKDALIFLDRAVLLAPKEVSYNRELAFVYAQQGYWEKALAIYKNIALIDDNPTTMRNFSIAIISFYKKSRNKETIQVYLDFLHINGLLNWENEINAYILKMDKTTHD